MPDQVQVYLPTQNGIEKVWVRLVSGTKADGIGIIETEPKAAMLGRSKFKLGDEIMFSGGNARVTPKFIKRLGNKMDDLKKAVAQDLVNSMTAHLVRS